MNSQKLVVPPIDLILVSSGEVTSDIDLPENCRGLLVGVSGSLNVTMSTGEDRDLVPMFAGVNPGMFTKVRISAGGATNIWAIV